MFIGLFAGGGVWALSRAAHLAASCPSPTNWIALAGTAYFTFGSNFAILLLARSQNYRVLEIDLDRRTFHFVRMWPFRSDSGSLDEVSGVSNSAGYVMLVRKRRQRFGGRGYTLGVFGNSGAAASATADRLAAEMGLSRV